MNVVYIQVEKRETNMDFLRRCHWNITLRVTLRRIGIWFLILLTVGSDDGLGQMLTRCADPTVFDASWCILLGVNIILFSLAY